MMKRSVRFPGGVSHSCPAHFRFLVREDLRSAGRLPRVLSGLLILDPVWLLVLHRLAHKWYETPLRPVAWVLKSVGQVLYGADIHPGACLGRRAKFAHTVGVVVGGGVRVESDVQLFANVTLGADSNGDSPQIGSRVTIYTGACVFGDVTVGEGSRVGANAVVTRSVPSNSLAVGVPARIVDL